MTYSWHKILAAGQLTVCSVENLESPKNISSNQLLVIYLFSKTITFTEVLPKMRDSVQLRRQFFRQQLNEDFEMCENCTNLI